MFKSWPRQAEITRQCRQNRTATNTHLHTKGILWTDDKTQLKTSLFQFKTHQVFGFFFGLGSRAAGSASVAEAASLSTSSFSLNPTSIFLHTGFAEIVNVRKVRKTW